MVEEGSQTRFARAQCIFSRAPFGQVAQARGEHSPIAYDDLGNGQLDGEQQPVRPDGLDLDPAAKHVRFAAVEVTLKPVRVGVAQVLWHDQVADGLAQHERPIIAERPFRRGIKFDHPALVVDDDEALERRPDHRGQNCAVTAGSQSCRHRVLQFRLRADPSGLYLAGKRLAL